MNKLKKSFLIFLVILIMVVPALSINVFAEDDLIERFPYEAGNPYYPSIRYTTWTRKDPDGTFAVTTDSLYIGGYYLTYDNKRLDFIAIRFGYYFNPSTGVLEQNSSSVTFSKPDGGSGSDSLSNIRAIRFYDINLANVYSVNQDINVYRKAYYSLLNNFVCTGQLPVESYDFSIVYNYTGTFNADTPPEVTFASALKGLKTNYNVSEKAVYSLGDIDFSITDVDARHIVNKPIYVNNSNSIPNTTSQGNTFSFNVITRASECYMTIFNSSGVPVISYDLVNDSNIIYDINIFNGYQIVITFNGESSSLNTHYFTLNLKGDLDGGGGGGDDGFEDGYQAGYLQGVEDAGNLNYVDGYNEGFSHASSKDFGKNLLGDAFQRPIEALNSFVLFSMNGVDVTFGGLIGCIIALLLFIAFMKMFAGG